MKNEPAYPIITDPNIKANLQIKSNGLTKLEYFAAKANASLIKVYGASGECEAARIAVVSAKALIAELEKEQGE